MSGVTIYTDGACRGNPGSGGWGALLISGSKEKEVFGGAANTTSNRMELTAAIEGLRALKQHGQVRIYTDSEYVRRGITEWIQQWKSRGWKTAARTAVKNEDLWRNLDEILAGKDIEWHWVKGHSGHPGNERADQLANRGVDEMLAG
jgi:ribonuclease HI